MGKPENVDHRPQPVNFPPDAMVRVSDICRNRKTGHAGILPINRSTWYAWVKSGRVPAGRKLGPSTTVWPLKEVLAAGQGVQA